MTHHFFQHFKIGWRTIKTVVGVFIILVLYHWLNRKPAALAALACVFTMRDDVPTSIQFGRYRIFGNALGAIIAGIVAQLEFSFGVHHPYLHILFVTFGILILIVSCNSLNLSKSIVNSSATFFVVLLTVSNHQLFIYTVNRVLDAIIGAVIAITVNQLLPGPNKSN